MAQWVSLVVPFGWLGLGAQTAAAGSLWPALLGSSASLAVGGISLRRSYTMTLRLYRQGFQTPSKRTSKRSSTSKRKTTATEANVLERQLPWLPDQASAVVAEPVA